METQENVLHITGSSISIKKETKTSVLRVGCVEWFVADHADENCPMLVIYSRDAAGTLRHMDDSNYAEHLKDRFYPLRVIASLQAERDFDKDPGRAGMIDDCISWIEQMVMDNLEFNFVLTHDCGSPRYETTVVLPSGRFYLHMDEGRKELTVEACDILTSEGLEEGLGIRDMEGLEKTKDVREVFAIEKKGEKFSIDSIRGGVTDNWSKRAFKRLHEGIQNAGMKNSPEAEEESHKL